MRIIPKTAKVKIEFFRNVSLLDIFIGLFFLLIEVLLFLTNMGLARYFVMLFVLCLAIGLYLSLIHI